MSNYRGRKPGSKNKNKAEFDSKYDRCARQLNFDPVSFLFAVASGTETTENWTKENRVDSAKLLINKRFANKRDVSGVTAVTGIPEQMTLTYDDSNRGKPVLTPVPTVGTEG